MYSQQQQQQAQRHHPYHPNQQQHSYPIADSTNYAATNPNIHYLSQQQPQQLDSSSNNNNANMSSMYNINQPNIARTAPPPQHHVGYTVVPPEPVPSATDTQPTSPLTISQLAEFASTMVFLMWHVRRASVMALHDVSKIQQSHTDDHDPGHSRETANIANCKSSSFKKFCEQVNKQNKHIMLFSYLFPNYRF
jgi:hypothetical protein